MYYWIEGRVATLVNNPPNVGFQGRRETQADPADPRPTLVGGSLVGARCTRCGHGFSPALEWCPRCLGGAAPTKFRGTGVVWAATLVHLPMGPRTCPWAVAYIDLDDGPRLLGHLDQPIALAPGTAVELIADDHGDPVFGRTTRSAT